MLIQSSKLVDLEELLMTAIDLILKTFKRAYSRVPNKRPGLLAIICHFSGQDMSY